MIGEVAEVDGFADGSEEVLPICALGDGLDDIEVGLDELFIEGRTALVDLDRYKCTNLRAWVES